MTFTHDQKDLFVDMILSTIEASQDLTFTSPVNLARRENISWADLKATRKIRDGLFNDTSVEYTLDVEKLTLQIRQKAEAFFYQYINVPLPSVEDESYNVFPKSLAALAARFNPLVAANTEMSTNLDLIGIA